MTRLEEDIAMYQRVVAVLTKNWNAAPKHLKPVWRPLLVRAETRLNELMDKKVNEIIGRAA